MTEQHESYVAYVAVLPGHDAWVAMCPCGWKSSRGNETQAWRYREEHNATPSPEAATAGGQEAEG